MRKSPEEVARIITQLEKELSTTIDKIKRRNIGQRLYHFKHYNERIAKSAERRAKKRNERVSLKRNYTQLELELAEAYNRDHPKKFIENEKTKKIIPKREIVHNCCKCKKPITTQYSYTTLDLMTKNIYYCEKCKTNDLMRVYL